MSTDKSKLPFKLLWITLMEAVIFGTAVFIGGFLLCSALSPAPKTASALVFFTNTEETGLSENYGIDYTARKVSLLRQATLSSEALETAVRDTSLSVMGLTDHLTVERLGDSDGVLIILSGLDSPGEAPIILGMLLNYLEKNFEGGEFHVLSYCDPESPPKFPLTAIFLSLGIAAGAFCFKAVLTVREKRYRKKRQSKRAEKKQRSKGSPRPVPGKRYIETAMIRARSLGTADSSAPEGLEKSGYIHAAKVLLENAGANGISSYGSLANSNFAAGCPIIAVCAAHKFETERAVPIDGTFAAYLSCALAEQGSRTALIECDLKNPVIGKIFRKTGKGGLADMASGTCTVWDILLPNARKGVDIICDKKAYPAPPAVFSASCFGGLLNYLSSQYDVILLHAPKCWSCPEWDLIYRFCTGFVAVTEEGKTPDKTCAMGILDAKGRFTGLAAVRTPIQTEEDMNAAKNAAAKKASDKKSPAKKTPKASVPGVPGVPGVSANKTADGAAGKAFVTVPGNISGKAAVSNQPQTAENTREKSVVLVRVPK